MNSGIYLIKSPNSSIYIGLTTDTFKARWQQHFNRAKNNSHHCSGVQSAFNKYGWDNLIFEVLEEIPIIFTEQYYKEREQYWWDYYKALGYNIYNGRPSGTGSVYHTKESRENLSRAVSNKYYKDNVALFSKIKEIRNLAANPDISNVEIASILDVSLSKLRTFLRNNSIQNVYKPKPKWNLDLYPILDWYLQDRMTMDEIAKKISCPKPTVVNYLKSFKSTDERMKKISQGKSIKNITF